MQIPRYEAGGLQIRPNEIGIKKRPSLDSKGNDIEGRFLFVSYLASLNAGHLLAICFRKRKEWQSFSIQVIDVSVEALIEAVAEFVGKFVFIELVFKLVEW